MKPSKINRNSTAFSAAKLLLLTALLLLLLSTRGSALADRGWKLDITRNNLATPPRTPSTDPIFTDATAAAGLNTGPGFPFGDPIWGDFDNDGDIDLFVDNRGVEEEASPGATMTTTDISISWMET